MPEDSTNPVHDRNAQAVLTLVGLGAVVGAGLLSWAGSASFQPYFGSLDPLPVTTAVALAGAAALAYLRSRGWFDIRRKEVGRDSLAWPALLATLLAVPVIVVDLLGGFPREINVAVPEALLFYPVIALVAETVFHVVPMALFLGLLGPVLEKLGKEKTIWVCVVLASSIEPIFQVVLAGDDSPAWAVAYVGLHLVVFGLSALYFFKRYGFLSMYAFRVVYYLHWHILWGVARLHLLF